MYNNSIISNITEKIQNKKNNNSINLQKNHPNLQGNLSYTTSLDNIETTQTTLKSAVPRRGNLTSSSDENVYNINRFGFYKKLKNINEFKLLKKLRSCNINLFNSHEQHIAWHNFHCKSKFCQVCNHNKAVKKSNALTSYIEKSNSGNVYKMLTLTTENFQDVSKFDTYYLALQKCFSLLIMLWRKRHLNISLYFRCFEVTYSKEKGYHLHFHIFLDSAYIPQEQIKADWERLGKENTILSLNQYIVDIRQVDAVTVKEVVKYMMKNVNMIIDMPDDKAKTFIQKVKSIKSYIVGGSNKALFRECEKQSLLDYKKNINDNPDLINPNRMKFQYVRYDHDHDIKYIDCDNSVEFGKACNSATKIHRAFKRVGIRCPPKWEILDWEFIESFNANDWAGIKTDKEIFNFLFHIHENRQIVHPNPFGKDEKKSIFENTLTLAKMLYVNKLREKYKKVGMIKY